MLKRLFLVVVSIFVCIGFCSCEEKPIDLPTNDGDESNVSNTDETQGGDEGIKLVTVYLPVKTTHITARSTSTGVYEYDEFGLNTVMTYYDEYGAVTRKQTNLYDDKGQLIQENGFLKTNTSPWVTSKHEYDADGNCIRTEKKYEDATNVTEYEYDDAGRLVSQKEYKYSQELYRLIVTEYNEDNSYLVTTTELDQGVVKSTKSEKYQEDGSLLELIEKDANGEIVAASYYEYKYNEKGQSTSVTVTDKNQTVVKTGEYQYNEKGLLTYQKSYTLSSNYLLEYLYSYDENNNKTQRVMSANGVENIVKFEYERVELKSEYAERIDVSKILNS